MGLWAPVLLWNPAILLLQNITKSIKTMLKLTFYPNTHVYQQNTHKMLKMHLQAYRPQQPTVYYNSPEKQQSIIQEGR